MKKAHLGLLALATIVGVGSAFTKAPKHFSGTTYYAIVSGGSFVWTQTDPQTLGMACTLNIDAYCTIHTLNGFIPQNGIKPNASDLQDHSDNRAFITQ